MFNIKKIALIASLSAVVSANSAFADNNRVYVQVNGGWANSNSFNNKDLSNSINSGLVGESNSNMLNYGTLNFADNDFARKKNKYNFGGAIGYKVDEHVRVDLSFSQFNTEKYSLSKSGNDKVNSSYKDAVTPSSILGNSVFLPAGASAAGAELATKDTRIDFTGAKASLKFSTIMLNTYYDFSGVSDMITPYATLGLGIAMVKVSSSDTTNIAAKASKNKFAYQLGLGVVTKLSEKFAVDIGYRFTQLAMKSDLTKGKHIKHNAINLGLRVNL